MTQSSLLGFGNKGAARWGCTQHCESQKQQLRLGMVGCLRRPSCHGTARGISVLCPLPPHTSLSLIPTFLLHIAKNPTRNHVIIGGFECQEVILCFLPWCRGQSTCTQYLPGGGVAELLLFHCTPPIATFPDKIRSAGDQSPSG